MSDGINVIITNKHLPATADFKSGVLLLVDKPKTWTSFDVVNKIRYKVKHKLGVKKIKVGHAGTLDPMATGLLLICVGKYTKLIESLQGMDKSYDATIKLGATTASYDAEEEENATYPTDHIDLELIQEAKNKYVGPILQKPPMFSAIKVDGVRLYKKARKGQEVEIKPRPVTIHEIDIRSYEAPNLSLSCNVSKGTYIRSLAHDLGQSLDSGGYLTQLRRTTVGQYHVDDSQSIEAIIKWIEEVDIPAEE